MSHTRNEQNTTCIPRGSCGWRKVSSCAEVLRTSWDRDRTGIHGSLHECKAHTCDIELSSAVVSHSSAPESCWSLTLLRPASSASVAFVTAHHHHKLLRQLYTHHDPPGLPPPSEQRKITMMMTMMMRGNSSHILINFHNSFTVVVTFQWQKVLHIRGFYWKCNIFPMVKEFLNSVKTWWSYYYIIRWWSIDPFCGWCMV